MPLMAVFHLAYPALAWVAVVVFATLAARFAISAGGRGWIPAATLVAVASLGAVGGAPLGHAALLVAGLGGAAWLAARTYRNGAIAGVSRRAARTALAARFVLLVAILLVIARPGGQWSIVDWRRPLLIVLLDQSRSMSIVDPDTTAATQPTIARADIANEVLRRADLARLKRLYELRIRAIGDDAREISRLVIEPSAPVTSIEAALRVAAQLRSGHGDPARTVLLISDGGENLADSQRVRQAVLELAAAKCGLLAFGVGPSRGGAVLSIDPLQIPARIGTRERLLVPVTLHSAGCRNADIELGVAWNDSNAETRSVRPSADPAISTAEFSVTPPGPGVHRLTLSARLPDDLGGALVSRSALVEVRDDRIRVLILDDQFRSEAAFISRALRTDPAFVVEQRILAPTESTLATDDDVSDADAFDVILVGDLTRCRRPGDAYDRIAAAVVERGAGLLFVGGAATLTSAAATRSSLIDFLPTRVDRTSPPPVMARLIPTERGLAHPVFATQDAAAALSGWRAAPAVACEPLPGGLKPLAEVLATDEQQNPLLVAAEIGRGRVLQIACRETWPWALASDAGFELHRRTWRQLVRWLANRRPRAWVLTDQPDYLLSAISSGREKVQIRAGISGLGVDDRLEGLAADLEVVRETEDVQPVSGPSTGPSPIPRVVPLVFRAGEWQAELPGSIDLRLTAGRYRLDFTIHPDRAAPQPGAVAAPAVRGLGEPLRASSVFEIASLDRELEPPTHNLGLLRDAAEATRTFGGRYASIEALPAAVEELLRHDVRQRVETIVDYDVARRQPWLLLAVAVLAAAVEWSIRRGAGLR
ncbi:MAG: hypothetical protein AMXMBFR47_11690 [Planctomycetota bacterium]